MSSLRDEVSNAASALGFKFAGYDGSGHIVWAHPNGARHSTPATPSEYRGVRNAIATLERLSGNKIDRPNHRRGRKSVAFREDPEVEASRRRHSETFAAKLTEREEAQAAEAERRRAADAAAASDRRRREIEQLMRGR